MEYRTLGRWDSKSRSWRSARRTSAALPRCSLGPARDGRRASLRRHRSRGGSELVRHRDVYSGGASEPMLGEVISGRRDELLISTKVRFRSGPGPNDVGLSRHHIITNCEASLRRLHTDWIDLYQVHEWDGMTPLEETLEALDDLVRTGKVRYLGCSNYAAWQLMKALGVASVRASTAS